MSTADIAIIKITTTITPNSNSSNNTNNNKVPAAVAGTSRRSWRKPVHPQARHSGRSTIQTRGVDTGDADKEHSEGSGERSCDCRTQDGSLAP